MNEYDASELERLYNRIHLQKAGAFFCVVTNPPTVQREITDELLNRFPNGEAMLFDFAQITQANPDFEFSSFELQRMVKGNPRILLLMNFHLAGGKLDDGDFLQIINLSRDNLAEMPYVFVFFMPLYFRVKIARQAPDFNSFIRYRADFVNEETQNEPEYISENIYSPANNALLEYYKEKYESEKDPDSERAFSYLVEMLQINKDTCILRDKEFREFYGAFERLIQEYKPEEIEAVSKIARIYESAGEYDKALEWSRKNCRVARKKYGFESQETASAFNNIAHIYYLQGKHDKALEWYGKSLDSIKNLFGFNERKNYAVTLGNIARVYEAGEEYGAALRLFNEALIIEKNILGEEHPLVAITYNNMAVVYSSIGEYEEAFRLYKISLEIYYKSVGKEHAEVATTYHNVALTYFNQGDYAKALKWLGFSVYLKLKILRSDHPDTKFTTDFARRAFTALYGSDSGFDSWLAAARNTPPEPPLDF